MAKVFVCGDVVNMFSSRQFVGEELLERIKSADYAIANLEGCVYGSSGVVPKMMQHPKTVSLLKEAGFRMLLLANNHIADYGENAIIHTLEEASREGLTSLGAGLNYEDVYRPAVVNIGGVRIGIINMCEAHPHYYHDKNQRYGYAWIGDPSIETRIQDLRTQTDKAIAFIHGGLEHCTCPLGFFKDFYHWLCDCGIDIVVGGHPHIAQGIEHYGEKLICYSLGNFYFPRHPEADTSDIENHSYSLMLKIEKDAVGYEVIYHEMNNLVVDLEQEKDAPVTVGELSEILSPENYTNIHASTIKRYYEGLVSNLYHSSLSTMTRADSFVQRLKNSVKYLIISGRSDANARLRNKNFVHLINNETYRFIVNEYLKDDYAREHK